VGSGVVLSRGEIGLTPKRQTLAKVFPADFGRKIWPVEIIKRHFGVIFYDGLSANLTDIILKRAAINEML
jgi:hypothetical protein